jgi:cell division initiation protein
MPRLTPLEIQKREFSRKWKGVDPVEVESYLAIIAEEMEELVRANGDLASRVERLTEENAEHRERERILKETLLTAQQAAEDIRSNAHQQAELLLRDAQDGAERLTHNALQRSAEIEKAIHELKLHRANFRLQIGNMVELFQRVLEFDREDDEKVKPLSYLTRKADKGETAG